MHPYCYVECFVGHLKHKSINVELRKKIRNFHSMSRSDVVFKIVYDFTAKAIITL